MGCYATAFPGGRRRSTRQNAAALERAVGLRGAVDSAGSTRRRWSRPRRRGDIEVLWSSGGNFLDVLPAPDVTRTALGAHAAARAPGHRAHAPDARRSRATPSCCCRPRPVTSKRAAARRPRPSGGLRSVPRSRGRGSARRAASTRIFLDVARRVDPVRAVQLGCDIGAGDPRGDRARRAGVRRASKTCATLGDAIQVGGARLCEGGVFPTRDGRARFSVVVPADAEVPPGHFLLSTRRGQAVQLDGVDGRRSRSPAPAATRCCSPRPTPVRSASQTGDALLVRSPLRRDASACARRADPRRQRAGVLPRGERPARAESPRPDLGCSRLQRGRRGGPASRDPRRAPEPVRRRRASPCATRSRRSTATRCASGPTRRASTRSTSSPTTPPAACWPKRRCGS